MQAITPIPSWLRPPPPPPPLMTVSIQLEQLVQLRLFSRAAPRGRAKAEEEREGHEALEQTLLVPFLFLLYVLINGTHGLGFACKFTLIAIALTDCIAGIAACHDPELDPWFICTMGILVLGSAATHTAELYLRRSYAEKVQAYVENVQSRTEEAGEKRQLEERMEQLQTSNERLLYDVQRRGRPLDDDDDRSVIRRGLLAGPSQPYPFTGGDTAATTPKPSCGVGSSCGTNSEINAILQSSRPPAWRLGKRPPPSTCQGSSSMGTNSEIGAILQSEASRV